MPHSYAPQFPMMVIDQVHLGRKVERMQMSHKAISQVLYVENRGAVKRESPSRACGPDECCARPAFERGDGPGRT